MPDESVPRPSVRRAPEPKPKRFRVLKVITYASERSGPREAWTWEKFRPGDTVPDDLPGFDYAFCLRDGAIEEVS